MKALLALLWLLFFAALWFASVVVYATMAFAAQIAGIRE
jgi:hypothetical protein